MVDANGCPKNISKNISDILTSMNLEKPLLSTLAQRGNDSLVQQFLSENVKVTGEVNETVRSQLYMAAFWGIYDAVKTLVDSGADVNSQNPTSLWTPLHAACFQEHGKVIMFLLERKAEATMEDCTGRTPVDFASASDKIWPLFAACGHSRTTKPQLIHKGVLREGLNQIRCNDNIDMDMNMIRKENCVLPINYHRGGQQESSGESIDRNAYAASVDGDVLAGDSSFKLENEEQPNFNAWRN